MHRHSAVAQLVQTCQSVFLPCPFWTFFVPIAVTLFVCFFASKKSADSNITAVLGRHRLDGMGVNEAARGVEKIVNHPYYDSETFDNDISLVKLSSPVPMNDYISTICLASEDSVIHPGTYTWVTGWGTTSNGTILVSNISLKVLRRS